MLQIVGAGPARDAFSRNTDKSIAGKARSYAPEEVPLGDNSKGLPRLALK